jgi:membrane associated rhomboid family serine protease
MALNIGVYIACQKNQPLYTASLVRIGAKSTSLITEGGQAWRLLSMHVLHSSLWHLVANMVLLFHIGSPAESLLHKKDYLLLVLYSALGSACASCFYTPIISTGFSGVVFGLWGGFAAAGLRSRHLLSPIHKHYVFFRLIPYAAFALLCGVLSPHTDMASHTGGLCTGALYGCSLQPRIIPYPSFKTPFFQCLPAVFLFTCIAWFSGHPLTLPTRTSTCLDVSFSHTPTWTLQQEPHTCTLHNDAGVYLHWIRDNTSKNTPNLHTYATHFITDTLPEETAHHNSQLLWQSPLQKTVPHNHETYLIHTLLWTPQQTWITQYRFVAAYNHVYVFSSNIPAWSSSIYVPSIEKIWASLSIQPPQRL